MRKLLLILPIFFLFACEPSADDIFISENSHTILVDASRDGGGWWFPQVSNFSANATHQGRPLADYLRNMGFVVVELPRGRAITWSYLKQYKNVIRFGGFGGYAQTEINAYDSLLAHSASVLFVQDHLQNFPNDVLSSHLGLNFSGSVTGTVTHFVRHPITTGVSSLPYIAGSVIFNPDPNKITALGLVSAPNSPMVAMGVLQHPKSKIFFIGDGNGLEQLPQPFTDNLVRWLFQ